MEAIHESLGTRLQPEWAAAFAEVPRGVLVPEFLVQNAGLAWELVRHPDPRWSELVNRDVPLVSQLDGDDSRTADAADRPLRGGAPSSSSSQPSLMALMLAALDVGDGGRVLEIGTGSGYKAALLCHRLGSDAVTTIDIDPGVTAAARRRLAALGLHPTVLTGDGECGHEDGAPYDRLIATVGVRSVPAEWLTQCADGAVIVVPLDRRNTGGLLARLTLDHGVARGCFLPDYGGFMPVRALGIGRDAASEAFRTVDEEDGHVRWTDRPAELGTAGVPGEFFVALRTGGIDHLGFVPANGGPPEAWFADGSGPGRVTGPWRTGRSRSGRTTRPCGTGSSPPVTSGTRSGSRPPRRSSSRSPPTASTASVWPEPGSGSSRPPPDHGSGTGTLAG